MVPRRFSLMPRVFGRLRNDARVSQRIDLSSRIASFYFELWNDHDRIAPLSRPRFDKRRRRRFRCPAARYEKRLGILHIVWRLTMMFRPFAMLTTAILLLASALTGERETSTIAVSSTANATANRTGLMAIGHSRIINALRRPHPNQPLARRPLSAPPPKLTTAVSSTANVTANRTGQMAIGLTSAGNARLPSNPY